jgi:hypothetical protein
MLGFHERTGEKFTNYVLSINYRAFASQQGCQIFLGSTYQNGKNVPNDQKCTK